MKSHRLGICTVCFFMSFVFVSIIVLPAVHSASSDTSIAPKSDYPVQPVPFTAVHLQDEFWIPRIETNRAVTIPYAFAQCEETGRIDNFDIAGGVKDGTHSGDFPFDDTDAYKILEGAAYTLAVKADPKLDAYLDELIAKIARAQEEDGYLYTCRTNSCERLRNWMGPERWSKLRDSHELYNAGHMYEAAAAHFLATGKRNFLDVALKNADLIANTFAPDKLRIPPGHQIIEMGLVRLYRVTGEERFLRLAKFFLDERGTPSNGRKLWGPYNQDHKPVIEQDEAVGHAVRATYMYAGMADVAALTGDTHYLTAIDRIWDNVVTKKLYITGGVGATGRGEAFGENYELPNMSAYCETCAAIGNVYWNHRLFLLHADAKYIDVLERILYNGGISGVSLDGKTFFYPNPLASQGQHQRSPWFGCACCPGNITRFIASVPGYVYAVKNDDLFVNLYAAGKATIALQTGKFEIEQQTRYPWDGQIKLVVNPEKTSEITLHLRIPGWARNQAVPSDLYRFLEDHSDVITIKVNGEEIEQNLENGYATIRREWKKGDVVELHLPMPIRRIIAHENVEADRGKVALQRGPLVYCAEWPDQENHHVLNMVLPDEVSLTTDFRKDLFDGVNVIRGRARFLTYENDQQTISQNEQEFLAIPYYAWAHRGKGEMAVWLARENEAARPLAGPTLASQSKVTTSPGGKTPEAVNDQCEPKSSDDHSVSFFHWWPKKGSLEWIQYEFDSLQEVSTAEVYWFDDTGIGECRLPASWRILYRAGGKWEKVHSEDKFGVEKDRFNQVVFETVKTDAIRLEIQLKENYSAGIHEWRIK